MERRTALALATAAAGTVMAASAAFAANVGLLQHDDTTPVGVLDTSAIDSTSTNGLVDPTVVTVIVEDPPLQSDAPAVAGSDPASATDLAPALEQGDDRDDDSTEVDDEREDDSSSEDAAKVEHDDDDD